MPTLRRPDVPGADKTDNVPFNWPRIGDEVDGVVRGIREEDASEEEDEVEDAGHEGGRDAIMVRTVLAGDGAGIGCGVGLGGFERGRRGLAGGVRGEEASRAGGGMVVAMGEAMITAKSAEPVKSKVEMSSKELLYFWSCSRRLEYASGAINGEENGRSLACVGTRRCLPAPNVSRV